MDDNILNARNDIDNIDKEIMILLNERFKIVSNIGSIKKVKKSNIKDVSREAEILKKTEQFEYSNEIRSVYQSIFNNSYKIEE